MFNFNPMAFWAEKMNPMMNMNNCFSSNCCPITEFMKHWCGDNCYSNPMMHFYKHMMNCCHNHMMNCCNYNNWCDNNSHSKTSCNTNYSFDKNQNCNDNNYCSDFANGFNIYPMMMEKCMKIMSNAYKMSCNMSQNHCHDNSYNTNSCNTNFHQNTCDSNDWIKKMECWSSSWAENFGKLHGEMTKFNEQAMNYVKLINENIKVMKEQACNTKKDCTSSGEDSTSKKK